MKQKLLKKIRFCLIIEILFGIFSIILLTWFICSIIGSWDSPLMLIVLMFDVFLVASTLSKKKRQKLQNILDERYPTDTYTHNDLEDFH